MLNMITVRKARSKYNYKIHHVVQVQYEILSRHRFPYNNLINGTNVISSVRVFFFHVDLPYFSICREALLVIIVHSLDFT